MTSWRKKYVLLIIEYKEACSVRACPDIKDHAALRNVFGLLIEYDSTKIEGNKSKVFTSV